MKLRTLNAEDLFEMKSVADPQLATNGKELVYVETSIDKELNEYYSNLFYIQVDEKSEPVQWTYGKHKNITPRWSNDGKRLAFVSNRNEKNQIYIMNKSGGEARQITFCLNGASNPLWSPDGKKIAFQTSLKENESVLEQTERKEKMIAPLEVDQMKYKSDAQGFWDGSYHHIGIVDVETGEILQLTEGKADYYLQCWSPNGMQVALTADLNDDQDLSFSNSVYLMHIESKELIEVTNHTGYFGNVTWSPNGKYVGMLGHEREYENATLTKLWVYHTEEHTLTCLTPNWEVNAGDFAIGDFQQGTIAPGLLWSDDDYESFYFLATDHGNTVVYYGTVAGEIYPALLDQQHVYGLTTGGRNDRAVVAISKPNLPGDLFLLEVTTGEVTQLTNCNNDFLEEVPLAEVQPFTFKASDGLDVHGWMMKPTMYKEGEKYPMILEIHGGPHMMYANTYFHEFQLLAARGYAVVFTNPRGSHGYGQHFVDAVRGDYGGKDYDDLMEAVDFVLQEYPFIDENRLGVTGGSYGGFMTNWIIGHTDRFKAAVTQRSISNWISFYGVSDIGYYFTDWQIQADLTNIEKLWKHSPLAYVKDMNTPLLILHSEKDYRCPVEQAEQLYIALKHQKKQTKFVRFPESNHELSRSGKPNFRIDRLKYIENWFESYLK
ncbi:S9 family peptidase [Cytobacillus spongiae]|jgi:dipeptidyl aminopeptidase/acylaminoacyl peptidase|uniref:S9 family peptidase n=1 Tax=Cytobacillus spongiae TaxID=2901381 RepID=UPI001F3F690A|nr:S9 family peptidase [Cytobacillus spongiae]UII56918.1 S9 family peptidase [Cytobacillus spongiae]